jgi:VTC domain-containing protein
MPPAPDLRTNLGTWVVPTDQVAALAYRMVNVLPTEEYDPNFHGQYLETTYFDTAGFDLYRARRRKSKYLTLRVRCYAPPYDPGSPRQAHAEAYALSVKTEAQKFRTALPRDQAEMLLASGLPAGFWPDFLPADLVARLMDLAGGKPLQPVVTVCARRYAVEDARDRLTLDVAIRTDTGKRYPSAVLEYKSTLPADRPPLVVPGRPIKLSKFKWALSP